MANTTEQLRDIKPLVQIEDYSFYLYVGMWIAIVLLVLALIYWLVMLYLKSRKVNLEKVYLERMDAIKWDSPKRAAYEATEYGRHLANDERRLSLYHDMVSALEKYKYRADVPAVTKEDKRTFEIYKKVCRESV